MPDEALVSLREGEFGGIVSTEPLTAASPLPLLAKPHVVFLAIAYGISWTFWLLAWALARQAEVGDLLYNETLVWDVLFGDVSSTLLGLSALSLVGVYGPMIAGFVASALDPATSISDLWSRITRVKVDAKWYGLALLILGVVTVPTLLIAMVSGELLTDAPGPGRLLGFLAIFFLVQIGTSGTEEVGWRGYLTAKLLPGRDFWDTGWAVGLPWAIWHVPVVVMLFLEQGMVHVQIIGSLVGFGIGIVAMAILHTWFYDSARSAFLNILIHAAYNTVPLTIVLLFEGSPAAVVSNLLLWAVVVYLKRKYDRDQLVPG